MFSKSLWLFGWWLQSRVNSVTSKIVTVQIPCWGMAYLARRPPLSGVLAWCWWRLGLAKSRWKQELRSKVLKRQWNSDVWGMVGKARSLKKSTTLSFLFLFQKDTHEMLSNGLRSSISNVPAHHGGFQVAFLALRHRLWLGVEIHQLPWHPKNVWGDQICSLAVVGRYHHGGWHGGIPFMQRPRSQQENNSHILTFSMIYDPLHFLEIAKKPSKELREIWGWISEIDEICSIKRLAWGLARAIQDDQKHDQRLQWEHECKLLSLKLDTNIAPGKVPSQKESKLPTSFVQACTLYRVSGATPPLSWFREIIMSGWVWLSVNKSWDRT